MLAKFFIERPVFGVVIAIVIILGGLAAASALPIAQYPEIAPPTVQVTCSYPGASARVVADTVAAPIEQQVNGVEHMLYMSSQSTNDGNYTLTVTFKLGVDLNMAQVLVQNRVSLALPTLPDIVKQTGVSTKKKSPSILLVVNLFSPNQRYNQLYLSNYATTQLLDELARLDGVGDVNFMGQQDFSMRIWLNPDLLATRGLTASDVANALKEQNVQVAAGQLGQQPVPRGVDFQYTLTTLGRLSESEQFGNIVLKSGEQGQITYLKDVARIELGARNQDVTCQLDGKPSVGLAIYQLPGSNALQTADRIRAKMKELKKRFPDGIDYAIVYDTTPFIEESIHEVYKTLYEAVILVAIVVLLFLQDWKAMILPMIDVPVSLIGTFIFMAAMGFTLNNLTLFGLVLAIGIVVDDAIVVLENVERWIAAGLEPKEATIKAMGEITGPIIAITLVLSSVFLPSAFIGGISGQFYRQFALTIAASMMISATNAMTMTPSRAVMIFKKQEAGAGAHHHREALPWWGVVFLGGLLTYWLGQKYLAGPLGWINEDTAPGGLWTIRGALFLPGAVAGYFLAGGVNRVLARFFGVFNRGFDKVTVAYGWTVARSLRLSALVLLLYVGLLGLTYFGFTRVPTGFIPSQDKGYLVVNVQLPDASSLDRTKEVMAKVENIVKNTDGVAHMISVPGQSFILNANSPNFASMFVILKPFEERHGAEFYSDAIAGKLRKAFYENIEEAQISVFGAPPVDGLGNAGGFKLMVQDRADVGLDTLQEQTDNLVVKGNQQPGLVGLFSSFRANTPQFHVDVNRSECKSMGVELSDVFNTLQINLGGYYVNDINLFGRTWQVNLQADAAFRLEPKDVSLLAVKNSKGKRVPIGSVAQVRDSSGPVMITRYNMYPSAAITGASLPGVSSGTVVKIMDGLAERELPSSMSIEWTELTYLQIQEGSTVIFAFAGAVILVFLILASQYESWSLPLAVILVVPMCLLCALIGIVIAGMDINIFVQVGFVVLVGLASKNAILIVEFAREKQREGLSLRDATLEACRLRLRPIIMTSFAFILGVLPLVISTGAGAEMRRTLGTAVFSGMFGVTLFGIFLTPVFFYLIAGFGEGGKAEAEKQPVPVPKEEPGDGRAAPETAIKAQERGPSLP
jgi:multidrug efflux pump subunit AcrB